MDDVSVFFRQPSLAHLWFYLLGAVLALYALNTLLATARSVSRKWRFGLRAPQLYAASIVHLSFLVGLLAHLVGGLAGGERGQVVVAAGWTDLGDGRQARVTDLATRPHPNGSPKQVLATLELRDADGAIEIATVHYNGPLSAGLGSDLFLLVRSGEMPVANLARGEARCVVGQDESCRLGDVQVSVGYLGDAASPQGPLARVQVKSDGGRPQAVWLRGEQPQSLDDGTTLTLASIERQPAVLLRHRHAPGNPWALLASLLLSVGLLLMWRRLLAPAMFPS